jgi:DNA repair protein RadC
LYRFGSIARISQASEIELRQTANEGENWVDALIAVRQLMQDGLRETLVRTQIGENPDALTAYLLATMQNLCEERMLAIFADAAGYIIAEEVVAQGSQKGLFVTPRNLFGRALNLDARRIILAHNHPSGCATPSKRDVAQTRVLSKMAVGLGLMIEDHLIIGYRQVTSMKNRGLM